MNAARTHLREGILWGSGGDEHPARVLAPATSSRSLREAALDHDHPHQRSGRHCGRAVMPDNRPLSGIRVLDLTQVYAGPTCTRVLADLGAEVIKVEGLRRMDITRNFLIADNDSAGDYWNHGGYFPYRNAGKKSLTLDWGDPGAIELLKRLVPECDIVAESFTPRVMAAHGLDYESLTKLRPDIIMISLSGYGQTGPW